MRSRDRNTALVLGGMLALNVIVAAGAAAYLVARERSWRRTLADLEARASSAERVCSTAAAVVAALADGAPSSLDEDPEPAAPVLPPEPVVIGYGQTRSRTAFWIYRDTRDEDGMQRREYIQRIPFEVGSHP